MQRRDALKYLIAGVCGIAASAAHAHTPYNQWQVYRRKHLLIGCHKDAADTYVVAKKIVGVLDEHLPDARARVARAPTAQRIASLMGTDQMDVAVMSAEIASDMAAGTGDFIPYGKIALRTLLQLEDWILVCRADIPDRHAWLITDALLESLLISDKHRSVPLWHPGAQMRVQGKSMPQ